MMTKFLAGLGFKILPDNKKWWNCLNQKIYFINITTLKAQISVMLLKQHHYPGMFVCHQQIYTVKFTFTF
jgi:hypothetical protein